MSLTTLSWNPRSGPPSGTDVYSADEDSIVTQPSGLVIGNVGDKVRLLSGVNRFRTEGYHSVEIRLSGPLGSRQALTIYYGYRLSLQDSTRGPFGGIMLTDYETDGAQQAFLFSEEDFTTSFAVQRGADVSNPRGAMLLARRIMVQALQRLPVGEEPGRLLPWVRQDDRTDLLRMLEEGNNLGDDAPAFAITSEVGGCVAM